MKSVCCFAAMWCAASLIAVGFPGRASAQTAPAAGDADTSRDAAALGDIIVTADKKRERAQDVPTSLTVLSPGQLEDQGATQLADYAKQVPTLTVVGAGGAGTGQPVLRGVTTGNDQSASVGIYLDDVPFTPSSSNVDTIGYAFDPDLADVQRIEVLAGPQSTLYGASAVGGLIKFVTQAPSLSGTSGSIRVTGAVIDGGDAGGGVKASINTPLIEDRLGLQAGFFYRRDPGYVDNRGNGTDNVNHADVIGGRAALRLKITDDIETTLNGFVQTINQEGPDRPLVTADLSSPLSGRLAYSSPIRQESSIRYTSIADTTTWDIGFATLTNIASFSDFTSNFYLDYSSFGPLITAIANAPAGSTVRYHGVPDARKYSEEFRIQSSPGDFEWLLGLFYTDEQGRNPVHLAGGDARGILYAPSLPYANVYSFNPHDTFIEQAVFGDITYHFTPELEVTLGARLSVNHQDFAIATDGLLGTQSAATDSKDNATNYLGTATYKITPDINAYVRVASAYRPGGPNLLSPVQVRNQVPASFHSDTVWDYEGGFKGSVFDRRLTFTADGFHMDWSNIQLVQTVDGFTAVTNAAGATIDGAEFSATLAPLRGLTATLNGAYLATGYTGSVPLANVFKGYSLPFAPHFAGAAVADYAFDLDEGWSPTVGFTLAYRGRQNTPVANGETFHLPSYTTLDLRAGLDWDRYRLIARIENITNEFGLTGAGPSNAAGSPLIGFAIRPRTFGLSLEATF